MDFVADSLSDGRKIRVLTLIDRFTRECLALEIARSLPSRSVTEELDTVIVGRGMPRTIQVDNGSEFTSNHFDARTLKGALNFLSAEIRGAPGFPESPLPLHVSPWRPRAHYPVYVTVIPSAPLHGAPPFGMGVE